MIEIIPFSLNMRDEWDQIVRCSKNGNFLHLVDYWTYHYDRFDDCSLIIRYKNKPVAVFPACRINGNVFSHAGLTYAGLIYGLDLNVKLVIDIMTKIMAFYKSENCNKVYYKSIPHVFCKYPSQEDTYALFKLGFNLYRRDVSTVIELQSERPKYGSLRKRSSKKAVKSGVIIEESKDYQVYYQLLEEVLSKFDTKPVHSLDELLLLSGRFEGEIRLFVAKLENKVIAGTIVYDYGEIVHTQYLASSERGRELGALDLVLMTMIDDVFSDRKYFSFGISTEKNGMYLNEGLIAQKEGFGGRAVCHDFYELEL
ncbi:GNAT family N-acetyltransferase [Photobacterium sagamiensis]|uniref:GNAT family N-acetyltransferase n=1 Tax=Photobacterium sagamiensis TaxID=2910241 RepID=UPI003D1414DE